MSAKKTDPDTLYLGLIRQAVWGNMTMEAGVIILTLVTVLFVITQNLIVTAVIGVVLYLVGIIMSLGDPFYMRIMTIRFSRLKQSRTQAFWRGGRRYMP